MGAPPGRRSLWLGAGSLPVSRVEKRPAGAYKALGGMDRFLCVFKLFPSLGFCPFTKSALRLTRGRGEGSLPLGRGSLHVQSVPGRLGGALSLEPLTGPRGDRPLSRPCSHRVCPLPRTLSHTVPHSPVLRIIPVVIRPSRAGLPRGVSEHARPLQRGQRSGPGARCGLFLPSRPVDLVPGQLAWAAAPRPSSWGCYLAGSYLT